MGCCGAKPGVASAGSGATSSTALPPVQQKYAQEPAPPAAANKRGSVESEGTRETRDPERKRPSVEDIREMRDLPTSEKREMLRDLADDVLSSGEVESEGSSDEEAAPKSIRHQQKQRAPRERRERRKRRAQPPCDAPLRL